MKTHLTNLIVFCIAFNVAAQSFETLPDLDGDLDTWYDHVTGNSKTPILKGTYFYSSATKPISRQQNPFYKEDWDFDGNVFFEGREYKSMQIAYNIVKDYLLVWNWNMGKGGEKSLLVNQAKIDSFYVHGEKFIYSGNLPLEEKGFYARIMKGEKVSCYARKQKTIYDDGLEVKFKRKYQYFIIQDNNITTPFKNLSTLNKLFPEQKKQIKEFIKNSIGLFEKDNENHLKSVLGFYELALR